MNIVSDIQLTMHRKDRIGIPGFDDILSTQALSLDHIGAETLKKEAERKACRQGRVPDDLPKMSVRIFEVACVSAPKGVLWLLGDHRVCLSGLLHHCVHFFFRGYVLPKREFCWAGRAFRDTGVR